MPGIRVHYTSGPVRPRNDSEGAGEGVQVANTSAVSLYADDHIMVDAIRPEGYPVEFIESAGTIVCLEGHVYGPGRRSLLRNLQTLDHDSEPAAIIRSFADAVDGDFVILWYHRASQRVCVTGDRMTRLPVYYCLSDEGVLAARDQGFVLERLRERAVDALGLGQLLTFGFPLRARTLTRDVRRLLPGEVLVASPAGCDVIPPARVSFEGSGVAARPRTFRGCVDALHQSLVSACNDRRIAGHSDVLSLSGGIDSRTVGAGMQAVGGDFAAVTFVAPGSPHADERAIAREVAAALGARWDAYNLDAFDQQCMREIVRLKLGLSPIDLAFGLEYVRRTSTDHPRPVSFWTGEGADKLFCDHRAIPNAPTPDQLVRFIIDKNAVWPPEDVRGLVGVHPDDLAESVYAALGAHHVAEAADAYTHFLLAERVVRWHFEGEERHRTATWPIAPFYARELMALALAVPRKYKTGRRLYRALIRSLAPDVAAIGLPGGKPAPASRRYALEHGIRNRLRNNRVAFAAYHRLKRQGGAQPPGDDLWRRELQRYDGERPLPPPFDGPAVHRIASSTDRIASSARPLLLTAIWAATEIQRGTPTRVEA